MDDDRADLIQYLLDTNPGEMIKYIDEINNHLSTIIRDFKISNPGSYIGFEACKNLLDSVKLLDDTLIILELNKDSPYMPNGFIELLKSKCIHGLKMYKEIHQIQKNNINEPGMMGLKSIIDNMDMSKPKKKAFYDSKLFERIIYLKYDIKSEID